MVDVVKNIYNKIVELSDADLQTKLWLNMNNDTGLISSYAEVMSTLFDDFSFDDFVDNTASKMGLSRSVVLELLKLRDLLNGYNEKESDEEIINDIEWEKVVEQAKKVIEKWE